MIVSSTNFCRWYSSYFINHRDAETRRNEKRCEASHVFRYYLCDVEHDEFDSNWFNQL